MKNIANKISIIRIFLAIALVLIRPLSIAFYTIYIICGISDVVDGYIARYTNTTSKLGARLDSLADFILMIVMVIALYPILPITAFMVKWIIAIGILKVISVIVGLIKYKTIYILHSYGNKIIGLLLFVFPLTLAFFESQIMIYIICFIASISSIDELLINLTSIDLELNKKCLFF